MLVSFAIRIVKGGRGHFAMMQRNQGVKAALSIIEIEGLQDDKIDEALFLRLICGLSLSNQSKSWKEFERENLSPHLSKNMCDLEVKVWTPSNPPPPEVLSELDVLGEESGVSQKLKVRKAPTGSAF